jgi:hypothetical protein
MRRSRAEAGETGAGCKPEERQHDSTRSRETVHWVDQLEARGDHGQYDAAARDPDEKDEAEDEEDEQDGADEPALVREPDEDCLAADDQEAESERGKPPAGKQACP